MITAIIWTSSSENSTNNGALEEGVLRNPNNTLPLTLALSVYLAAALAGVPVWSGDADMTGLPQAVPR